MIGMPESVKAILDASIWRVRRIYLLRGLVATLFVAITATLVVMAVDACFTLFSDAARWLLRRVGSFRLSCTAAYFSLAIFRLCARWRGVSTRGAWRRSSTRVIPKTRNA